MEWWFKEIINRRDIKKVDATKRKKTQSHDDDQFPSTFALVLDEEKELLLLLLKNCSTVPQYKLIELRLLE